MAGAIRYLGPCLIPGELHDLGDYPALVPARRPNAVVRGELIRVLGPGALRAIDAWELFDPRDLVGSLYHRVRVTLVNPRRTVWTYLHNGPADGPRVPSGDWRRHLAMRRRTF